MNIGELSRLTGVSVRALRHYDSIGLLRPMGTTEAGYRQYDDEALKRLYVILLLRELGMPLKEIRQRLDDRDFDALAALDEQIARLEARRERLDHLIMLARGARMIGLNRLRLTARDFQALDATVARLPTDWADTPAMRECQEKVAQRSEAEQQRVEEAFQALLASFGKHPEDPASPEARAMVQTLRDFISEHFYACDRTMLRYLAEYFDGGGAYTRMIDGLAGEGTAAFLAAAMRAYAEQ